MTQEQIAQKIDWIENDPKKYNCFEDGFRFLGALQVHNSNTNETDWEFDGGRG